MQNQRCKTLFYLHIMEIGENDLDLFCVHKVANGRIKTTMISG